MFLHCETLLFTKRKTRSANHVNTNRNHMMFYRKHKTACLFHLYLHGLLNAFPTLQKVVFLHCETLLVGKWNSGSANHTNTNENGKPFYVFCKITYDFCLYLHGLLNAISESQKGKFPNPERYFLQSGKRVQQTMVLDRRKG